ncbi:protein transport protein SEC31, putative [Bodo saltans]|uniref:Protein transport protein SEC31, putative n=1 Tax=Bodo saltans TaxID=75058 RepID=A0A0S4ISW1_BODSA|nr:protein transport protein SEC31, putative [Bodo saltans]|eukprot:CUE94406.1 protein transport protein SEC31, putative [Bodo saltans]
MKLKEAKLCCAFSWSPAAAAAGLMIATGSVAGAMDDDFNSEAYLEIRKVDVHDTANRDMIVIGRTLMTDRVFRIDWSPHGGPNGILAGCFTDGSVQVWSVDTILENFVADPTKDTSDPLLCRIEAHTGSCRSLQFSPTQPHYLATGGQDKELYIWTLQDPREPAAVPALPKATHPGELTDVKWNPKFAHILATSTSTGTVTVWDLKARRTALTFNVSASQPGAANCIAWHPDVSTHIAVARDDVNPVVQLWDLKKAMAPIRELRGHSKGVTGLSWNSEDPSLLLSCGCDGRTLCWNPTTGDILGELPAQDNWIYEVQWCPKATAILATSSFESTLGVFSAQEIACSSSGAAVKTVPKWLRRPCGAAFGIGGRFVAPVKGTNNISITHTTHGDASGDKTFRQSLFANAPHTQERIELLKSLDMPLIAASEACVVAGNRQPLLEYLGFDASAVQEAIDNMELPFHKEEEEFEELLIKSIITARYEAGVSLCLAASRYDDAFAVAQLGNQSSALTMRVIEKFTSAGRLRFYKYLKAVLCNSFDDIAQDVTLPWREVLALFATYLNQQHFTEKANALAATLQARNENEGAAAAFVCSANVDGFADLQSALVPARRVVQIVTVLEQTVGRQCVSATFAQALATYATFLANAGDFEGALLLSNRAAQLGDAVAAVVADRIQYHVPSASAVKVSFPFTIAQIPDATSIECHMLANRQQQQQQAPQVVQQPQQQQIPQQQHIQPAVVQQLPVTQIARPQNVQNVQPQYQQASYAPVAAPQYTQPVQQQPQYTAPVAQPVQPQYAAPVPQQQPQYTAPVAQQQQQQQPPLRQQSPPIAPPVHQAPVYHDATAHLATARPPQQQPAPPVHQFTAPPPVVAAAPVQPTPSASGSPTNSLPRAGSGPQAALPPSALSSFNLSSLSNPVHQDIAQSIIDATNKVTDKRKRDAIEKSSNELFDRLGKGLITDDVALMLLAYAKSAGTAAGKENWRKLSDAHYNVVQHFLNIKFL